jgi:hypothetical protein
MVARAVKRLVPLAAAACATLAISGCTDHSSDEKKVRAVVNQFAAEHGPRACDLLTHNALVQVYGGKQPEKAHQQCVAASKRFTGAPIDITNIHWTTATEAKVSVGKQKAIHHYTVTVVKFGQRWRIDGIVRQ